MSEQIELSRLLRDAAMILERYEGSTRRVADLHRARILVETLYVRIETLEEELRLLKQRGWDREI
jgi:hypothetical protein